KVVTDMDVEAKMSPCHREGKGSRAAPRLAGAKRGTSEDRLETGDAGGGAVGGARASLLPQWSEATYLLGSKMADLPSCFPGDKLLRSTVEADSPLPSCFPEDNWTESKVAWRAGRWKTAASLAKTHSMRP